MRRPEDQRFRDVLVSRGVAPSEAAAEALAACEAAASPGFLELLAKRLRLDESRLLAEVAAAAGVEVAELEDAAPPREALKTITAALALEHRALPLRVEGAVLVVAVADPFDPFATDDIALRTGLEVRAVLADAAALELAIEKAYADAARPEPAPLDAAGEILAALEAEGGEGEETPGEIVKSVDQLLISALERGATRLYLNPLPGSDQAQVRIRMPDRTLSTLESPKVPATAMIARLKIMAGMDISERRRPQDGRLVVRAGNKQYDLLCAILPVADGESVTVAVRGEAEGAARRAKLPEEVAARVRSALDGGGLILVGDVEGRKGPELLRAAAAEADGRERVVVAIAEAAQGLPEGTLRVRINAEAGVNFAAALAAARRHDPDVVIIELLRDSATAGLALACAEDGAAVLAVVPTACACDAVGRLLDMGLEPARVASALRLAVFRRAVRRLCARCRRPGPSGYERVGCQACSRGYAGETALYEVLEPDDAFRRAVAQGSDAAALKESLARGGHRSFKDLAQPLVRSGDVAAADV